jgi:predicted DNA-binding protein (MmcQ/YjbR family)
MRGGDRADRDLNWLRAHCLAKPGTSEEHPFGPGALVCKVGGKLFAILGEDADPVTISLKCEPEVAELLRGSYDAVEPGYHLNKRHWITVTLDGSIGDEVLDWIDDSYDLVVDGLPRRVRDRLGAGDG